MEQEILALGEAICLHSLQHGFWRGAKLQALLRAEGSSLMGEDKAGKHVLNFTRCRGRE